MTSGCSIANVAYSIIRPGVICKMASAKDVCKHLNPVCTRRRSRSAEHAG